MGLSFTSNDLYINVKYYGAQGDGVTDDTQAIQKAIDIASQYSYTSIGSKPNTSFPSGGATVVFPIGIYVISAPILVTTRGISLMGCSYETSMLVCSTPSAGIVIGSSGSQINNWKVKVLNLTVDCNNIAKTGILIQNTEECFFESVRTLNSTEYGFDFSRCHLSFFRNVISAGHPTGMRIFNGVFLVIKDSNFYNNSTMVQIYGGDYGGVIDGNSDILFENTWFERFAVGFLFDNISEHLTCLPLRITGCHFLSSFDVQNRPILISNTTDTNAVNIVMYFERNTTYQADINGIMNSDYVIEALGFINSTYTVTKSLQFKVANNTTNSGPARSFVNCDTWNLTIVYEDNTPAPAGLPPLDPAGSGYVTGIDHQGNFNTFQAYNQLYGTLVIPTMQVNWKDNNITGELRMHNDTNDTNKYLEFYDGGAYQPILTMQSGPTANRPTTNLYSGRPYFDITLAKPIWYKSDTQGWVDATGTDV